MGSHTVVSYREYRELFSCRMDCWGGHWRPRCATHGPPLISIWIEPPEILFYEGGCFFSYSSSFPEWLTCAADVTHPVADPPLPSASATSSSLLFSLSCSSLEADDTGGPSAPVKAAVWSLKWGGADAKLGELTAEYRGRREERDWHLGARRLLWVTLWCDPCLCLEVFLIRLLNISSACCYSCYCGFFFVLSSI